MGGAVRARIGEFGSEEIPAVERKGHCGSSMVLLDRVGIY